MSDTCIFIYYVSSCRGKSVWYIFSYSANALILQWTPEPPPAKKKKKQQKKSLLSGFGAAGAQEEHDVSYRFWLRLRQAHFWPPHFSAIYVEVRLRAWWYIYIYIDLLCSFILTESTSSIFKIYLKCMYKCVCMNILDHLSWLQ